MLIFFSEGINTYEVFLFFLVHWKNLIVLSFPFIHIIQINDVLFVQNLRTFVLFELSCPNPAKGLQAQKHQTNSSAKEKREEIFSKEFFKN